MNQAYEFDGLFPEMTDKVKAILIDAMPKVEGVTLVTMIEVDQAINNFDFEGPYGMAKRLNLLVNNSGEDMAIEFMTFVNKIFPGTY